METRPEPVPGVWVEDGFVRDAPALFAELTKTVSWDERLRARKTASFGVPYNYSGLSYPVAPVPDVVAALMDRLSGLVGYRANNCLANYYPDGISTMGFHFDSTDELVPGTGISVISLGAERTITFRSQADRLKLVEIPLPGGSLLYMTAEVQQSWKHALLSQPGTGGRISLTFRCVRGG